MTIDDYLRCKAYGHAWEPTTPVEWFAKNWDKALHSACVRCQSTKVDDLDLTGRPWQTIYYHSDGYRAFLDKGMERAEARMKLYRGRKRNRVGHLRAV